MAKAIIGLHTNVLKDGTVRIKGIAIKSPYGHKDLCSEVKNKFGGKWNGKRFYWQYPLQADVIDYAKKIWKELGQVVTLSDACEKWYKELKTKQNQLISAKAKQDVKPEELKTSLANTLYDYQRVGVNFLSKSKGAILADDMGLGKTIQSLATIDEVGAGKALIVCPASIKLNWGDEIEKWLPGKSYAILDGNKKDKLEKIKSSVDIYVTNYATLREKSRKKVNGKWSQIDNPIFKEVQKKGFDVVVLDEAHRIKNRKSQQTKALHKIAKKAKRLYHLTGTPIMNEPHELWSLLHTIDPKKFSSFWRFVNRHCEVIDNGYGKEIGGVINPKEFREVLSPYMLRRMKEEVIDDMPELLPIQKQWVELQGKQLKIYNQMEQDMVAEIGEQEIAAPIIISKILRLKQIAVSPSLLGASDKVESSKISALLDILEGAGEQKVVIFTQFQKAAELVANRLKKKGVDYGLLHGGISTDERHKDVKRFQSDPNCKAFIATIKAGGLGINLTEGSIAVFLDKDWTPANNSQAVDRLHRIGQKNDVTVIELLAKNTIEEYIEDVLQTKQKTFDSLIEGKMTGKELLVNLKDKMRS